MPYRITQATAANNIAERQWFVGAPLNFTPFTSCIGIAARSGVGTNLFGLHLSLFGDGDHRESIFDAKDVDLVAQTMHPHNCLKNTVVVFGEIAIWQDSVPTAYAALIQRLQTDFGTVRTINNGSGTYTASLDNGAVVIT